MNRVSERRMLSGEATKALVRADLYHALAEVLSEPPDWLAGRGRDWPLTKAAAQLAQVSAAAGRAVPSLTPISAESLAARRIRYRNVFMGSGRPRFWLYESLARNGRLLHPSSTAIERLYLACGLQTVGAELPDHASMELAFLAHLARQQAAEPVRRRKWRQLEQLFIQQHAGQWLPALGRSLAGTADEVYAPIGRLLSQWLEEAKKPPLRRKDVNFPLPRLHQRMGCTLCGFCVQVCPTQALAIGETERETWLRLVPSSCTGCQKCAGTCPTGALKMDGSSDPFAAGGDSVTLYRSQRAHCPGCGQATISHSELKYVAARLGSPDWLPYCLSCRADLMENAS